VEVPAELTLGQAHDRVSRLELRVRDELPQVRDIHSHIEPLAAPTIPVAPMDDEEASRVRAQIEVVVRDVPEIDSCTRLHIRLSPGGGYDVVVHCLADPDMPVVEAHRLADRIESLLSVRIPGIKRVLVHVEPEGELDAQTPAEGGA
jgi:divalent metal cation (Fe/Co/Zn/Cd) transporter